MDAPSSGVSRPTSRLDAAGSLQLPAQVLLHPTRSGPSRGGASTAGGVSCHTASLLLRAPEPLRKPAHAQGDEESWSGTWNTDWDAWYGPNLWRSMAESRLIVMVVSPLWQASSWMLAECEAATKASGQVGYPKTLVWNPEAISITNPNYVRHLS